jgi:hypothetical protein
MHVTHLGDDVRYLVMGHVERGPSTVGVSKQLWKKKVKFMKTLSKPLSLTTAVGYAALSEESCK